MLIYKEVSIIDDSGENSIIDESLKPLIKRQLLLMGVSLGIYFVVAYFFGFMAGFIAEVKGLECDKCGSKLKKPIF
jgi:hypothetical protein